MQSKSQDTSQRLHITVSGKNLFFSQCHDSIQLKPCHGAGIVAMDQAGMPCKGDKACEGKELGRVLAARRV